MVIQTIANQHPALNLIIITVVCSVLLVTFGQTTEKREEVVKYDLSNLDAMRAEFTTFTAAFNKEYETEEETETRFQIFQENLETANRLNEEEQGTAVYGVTPFSDLTESEFQSIFTREIDSSRENVGNHLSEARSDSKQSIKSNDTKPVNAGACFDWTLKNPYMPPILDQGVCGSCYAFCSGGMLDILYSKLKKKITLLSKEQIVECADTELCDGAATKDVLPYLKKGLVLEKDYPYTLSKNATLAGKCEKKKIKNIAVKIKDYAIITGEDKIAASLPTCPVAIRIHVGKVLQMYMKGIAIPTTVTCPNEEIDLNHCLIVAGCRTSSIPLIGDYWVLRNSWGKSWGMQGYMYIKKGVKACGIGVTGFTIKI